MPNFEFEFNQTDRELVLSQQAESFGGTDYIRLIIYPEEAIENIATLPDSDEQAIFYSSLSNYRFAINNSQFGSNLNTLSYKIVGGGSNDFVIYKNPDGNIYIKPNEIFNDFGLPQGEYRIQVDFLNQLNRYETNIEPVEVSEEEVEEDIISDDTQDTSINPDMFFQFIIKQIST